MDLGQKYLDELDYENAIVAYVMALEIDPRCEEAYLALAEVYIAMGSSDQAMQILEEGYAQTGSEEIARKLEELNSSLEMEEPDGAEVQDVETEEDQDQEEAPQVTFVFWADAGLEDHVMDWRDANLETAMREITGIAEEDIMLSNVWEMITLDLGNHQISDISALGGLTNLTFLDLQENPVSDYSAVSFVEDLYY